MSQAPLPPIHGEDVHDPVQPKGLRLSDAESIAADLLDSADDGSLRGALADVVADEDAGPAGPRLADRIEAVREDFENGAAPSPTGLGVAAETALAPSAGDSPSPTAPDGEAVRPHGPASVLLGSEPTDYGEATASNAAAEIGAEEVAPVPRHGEAAAEPASSEAAEANPHAVDPPQPTTETAAATAPVPINGFDQASQIAAEASATAEALENLKRLLERRLPEAVARAAAMVSVPPAFASPVAEVPPASANPAVEAPAPAPAPTPPPLPAQATPRPASRPPAARGPSLVPPPSLPRERQQLDVRGFLAGFALSWAIGAVLYIYLMAG